MPTPHPDTETMAEWMDRCVSAVMDDGAATDSDQAVAMCSSMWEDAMKSSDGVINRAYSILNIKSVKEDERIIRGVATTPEPDRVGDIVEPLGVEFKNPLPLLWQHRSSEPVGLVKFEKPTKDGIVFEAALPDVQEPGTLKNRIDEAWQSIKHGLVRGVSIGFQSLESSVMKNGGYRFVRSSVLELSLVTIPANAEATIQQIKSIDRAALGRDDNNSIITVALDQPTKSPGVTGSRKPTSAPKDARKMTKKMTIAEQLGAFEAKRAANVARMDEVMGKAAEDAATLEAEESIEYDDLEAEVSKIDEHIVRLKKLEAANKAKAVAVSSTNIEEGSDTRSVALATTRLNPIISVKANVPQGTAFTRYCMAVAAAKGNRWEALDRARKDWHGQTPEVDLALSVDMPAEMNNVVKAAVGAGTTTDATWASPLVAYTQMASEFIALLRPATIIGRIPGLRMVPFNIQMPRTTTGSSVGWVGENAPKPVSSMAFDTVQLRWAKAAGIIVLTDELVRFSNPSAEAVVRGDLIDAMAQFLDRQFVDPSVAAVTNVSPASITNGTTAVPRTGVNQAAWVTDVTTLLNLFLTANLSTTGGVWIMSSRQALAFSLMLNALGQPFYPNITAEGGTLLGYPVISSENVPSVGLSPADGTPIIFAIAREIMLADDGQVVIDASNQASVQMDTAPDSPPTASSNMVSLWQMNMTGLRAERWINWLKRRSTAVAYISNANYA